MDAVGSSLDSIYSYTPTLYPSLTLVMLSFFIYFLKQFNNQKRQS